MQISRRDLLKMTAAGGTALSALVACEADLRPAFAGAERLRIADAKATPSVCPYCAVGCGTLVHTIGGEIVNIEGDPRSPVSQGNLCPKGAASYQLHVNPNRATRVLHRAPGATRWEVWDLERAMDRVAELVKAARDETFVEKAEGADGAGGGRTLAHSLGVFSLGGATLDNEWNHLQQKLMRGLGIARIENQARI